MPAINASSRLQLQTGVATVKLLTREIERALLDAPKDQDPADTPVIVKFFTPDAQATWYIVDAERGEDGDLRMFGFADLFGDRTCAELGYTLLSDIAAARGPLGLPVELDLYFTGTLADVLRQYKKL
jgi:hypothetical protein